MMTGPQPVQADAMLTIVLQAQQWNMVLQALSEAPYKIAAPLVQAIGEQLQRQTGPLGPQPNGLDAPTPQPN
jgi:hypothetical protein